MPILRSKDNKRKSDTVIVENAKARKVTTRTETERNVKVPIASQFKTLKEAHEILKKENIENLKDIVDLKLQVALLVHTRSLETVPQESKESQTDFKEEFTCQESVFQCKSNADLRLHTENVHSSDKLTHIRKYPCNNCGKSYNENWELMVHRKEKHSSAVKTDHIQSENGSCRFSCSDCWYKHEKGIS